MAYRNFCIALAVIAVIFATIGTAWAQLDNKPFSFRNSPTGGLGMSQGGKQAIINEKIFDSTPDNLQRGPNGELVDVIEGPGKSAIVFWHGTNSSIPGFHGTDFRGENQLMQAGVFNAYFGTNNGSAGFDGYNYAQFVTAAMINSWTMTMIPGNVSAPYYGTNSVDSWTSFVNSMNRF